MISEAVQLALIASFAPTLVAAGALVVGLLNHAKNVKSEAKLEAVAKTGESIHTLVNSNMGIQLRVSMIALQRVADLTKNDSDIEAAKLAAEMFRTHEANQKTVDIAATKPSKASKS